MDKLQVTRGIAMPFFPMRPTRGQVIKTKVDVADVWRKMRSNAWIAQPKLNEDRAVLAYVDGSIYIQNRYAQWMKQPVNAEQWTDLPDRTVLDGGVYGKKFYAFEALAVWGRSFLMATSEERVVMAFQMSRLCKVPWMFESPERSWLDARQANLPKYEGVVLKMRNAPYVIAGSPDQESANWFKCRWA